MHDRKMTNMSFFDGCPRGQAKEESRTVVEGTLDCDRAIMEIYNGFDDGQLQPYEAGAFRQQTL